MTIDAHQHFWKYNASKQPWITDKMTILRKDYLPDTLKGVFIENGIDGCIAVQVDQSEQETEFLLELAMENSFVKGVVGWIDLRAENLRERLDHYSQFPLVKGFRHLAQDESDPNFLIGKEFKRGIGLLHSHGFTYDILIYHHQLGAAEKLVRDFPEQKFVVDHIAKPNIKNRPIKTWKDSIQAIAAHKNVCCKVSGMVTENGWHNWKYADFVPYLDIVFDAFGTDRIMYGSDWPVCLLAAPYASTKGIIDRYIQDFDEMDTKKIMGKNAMAFYQLSI